MAINVGDVVDIHLQNDTILHDYEVTVKPGQNAVYWTFENPIDGTEVVIGPTLTALIKKP